MSDKSIRVWYRRLLFATVLVAVGWLVLHHADEIARYDFHIRWLPMGLGFLAMCAAYVVMLLVWLRLSRTLGLEVPAAVAARAWLVSQLGKYVPGKVVLLLVRLNAYRGHSRRKVSVATLLEYIVSLAAACVLILLAVALASQGLPAYVRWAAVVGGVGAFLLLWPPLLERWVNRILRLLGREVLTQFPAYGALLCYVGAYVLVGLLYGLSLYFVLAALAPVQTANLLILAGIYEAAGVIGIAAVFAPAGMGVREGVLMLVLPLLVARPAAIVGVLIMRIIHTLAELCLAGMAVCWSKARLRGAVNAR